MSPALPNFKPKSYLKKEKYIMAKQLLGKEVTDALNAKLIERANALKEKGADTR